METSKVRVGTVQDLCAARLARIENARVELTRVRGHIIFCVQGGECHGADRSTQRNSGNR